MSDGQRARRRYAACVASRGKKMCTADLADDSVDSGGVVGRIEHFGIVVERVHDHGDALQLSSTQAQVI